MHKMMGAACPQCGMGFGHKMGCGGMKGMGGGMKAMFMIMPWKIMMHAEELGLSEEQVAKIRNRHAEARKQMIQLKSQIKMNMIDVQNAIMSEEIDMPLAETKIREIGKLKSEKFLAMVQAMNDLRHIVTPEQRKKIKHMIMEWIKKGGMPPMEMEEDQEGGEEQEE